MSVALLDVNFLVALFDSAHIGYEDAHRWFAANKRQGWATCPITLNGCIRILSNPAYPAVTATPAEVAERLRDFCTTPGHHFWSDSISTTDDNLFRWPMIRGHQQITDLYLLGLAVHNHGRLATFDRSIPIKGVHGATPSHLAVAGRS